MQNVSKYSNNIGQGTLTEWGGVSSVDLLIGVACFVKKVNYVYNIKSNWESRLIYCYAECRYAEIIIKIMLIVITLVALC
jgi:hypothetical protein